MVAGDRGLVRGLSAHGGGGDAGSSCRRLLVSFDRDGDKGPPVRLAPTAMYSRGVDRSNGERRRGGETERGTRHGGGEQSRLGGRGAGGGWRARPFLAPYDGLCTRPRTLSPGGGRGAGPSEPARAGHAGRAAQPFRPGRVAGGQGPGRGLADRPDRLCMAGPPGLKRLLLCREGLVVDMCERKKGPPGLKGPSAFSCDPCGEPLLQL